MLKQTEKEYNKFNNIIQTPIAERLDQYILTLTDEEINKIINYIKEWNTMAKNSFLSQILLYGILRLISFKRLNKYKGILENIEILIAYSEKHYQRIDRLHQASYVLEYMTSLMTLLPYKEDSETTDQIKAKTSQLLNDYDDEDDNFVPILFQNTKDNKIINKNEKEITNNIENSTKKSIKRKNMISDDIIEDISYINEDHNTHDNENDESENEMEEKKIKISKTASAKKNSNENKKIK